jgi:hypothetical protein
MRPMQLLRVERIAQRQRLDAKRLNCGETADIPVNAIVGTLQLGCQTRRFLPNHSPLIPARLMTSSHLFCSATMSLPNSAELILTTAPPCSSSFF